MTEKKENERYEGVENRVQLAGLGLLCAMFVLCAQFWHLQVLNLSEFYRLAEDNRVWQKRLTADRGMIFAATGEILADNRASADIVMVPGDCPPEHREDVFNRLERWVGVPADKTRKKVEEHRHAPFTQILLKRDVSKADRVRIEENQHSLPGVTIVVHPTRRYLQGRTAGQLLGYLGEINADELERMREQGYFLGDLLGKDGLERQYESLLRGRDGHMLVTRYASGQPQLITDRAGRPYISRRDSRGHLLDLEAPPIHPRPGNPLHLTLDLELQRHCEQLLQGHVGAIVVLNAETGAVLAMASEPGFDPGVFVNRGLNEERLALLSGESPNRMTHRAYREIYPPASVLKIALAAAALEEGIITPETRFFCPGHFQIDGRGRRWHCWQRHGHGSMDVVEALAFSCDVFFYHVGLRLGVERISAYARAMGLGAVTGIDLPGEMPGLIPDSEWKARVNAGKPAWERQWYPGETVNLSIGQGATTSTPLQTAVMTAFFVNGGRRIRPHLNRDLGPEVSDPIFSDATLQKVGKGMRMCVEKTGPAPTGTGIRAHIPGITILGKTGTAQVVSLAHIAQYADDESIPYEKRHHAWFVAGVTNKSPKISVSVLIEHGHSGGRAAAPIARDVISFFYDAGRNGLQHLMAAEE